MPFRPMNITITVPDKLTQKQWREVLGSAARQEGKTLGRFVQDMLLERSSVQDQIKLKLKSKE